MVLTLGWIQGDLLFISPGKHVSGRWVGSYSKGLFRSPTPTIPDMTTFMDRRPLSPLSCITAWDMDVLSMGAGWMRMRRWPSAAAIPLKRRLAVGCSLQVYLDQRSGNRCVNVKRIEFHSWSKSSPNRDAYRNSNGSRTGAFFLHEILTFPVGS